MRNSSEASSKAVKKFTSAILIVSLIWGFIGYSFCNRYIHLNQFGSIIGAVIMVFIIIQIERQIILNVGKNKFSLTFRFGIALIMAILGSLIIDQIIFKEDIEIAQSEKINARIEQNLEAKISMINDEISRLDTLIVEKNVERNLLLKEITTRPTIKMPSNKVKRIPGKFNKSVVDKVTGEISIVQKDTMYIETEYTSSSVPNPKGDLIPIIENDLNEFATMRSDFIAQKLQVRKIVEKEEKGKIGFLDELDTMYVLLSSNKVSLFVWLLWFFFFMFIELFVVTGKLGSNNETDYDITILHQRDVRIKAIEQLSKKNRD
ncbi:DUF4407 domain-containing protein [uncultured Lutibacter sp.]|uniref:DUF4407 domain-containing protein n=1 Tax=uncultured Lutibacter sp. TaxID=437739 RepID=UPI00262B74DE|nr:DUF4407 domain-containing protein [uncultured Lutibacter sp.]